MTIINQRLQNINDDLKYDPFKKSLFTQIKGSTRYICNIIFSQVIKSFCLDLRFYRGMFNMALFIKKNLFCDCNFLLYFHTLLHVLQIVSFSMLSISAGTSARLHLACIQSGGIQNEKHLTLTSCKPGKHDLIIYATSFLKLKETF